MFVRRIRRGPRLYLILASLSVAFAAAFVLTRVRTSTGQDDPSAGAPPVAEIAADESEPAFAGELLGIWVGPPDRPVPAGHSDFAEICPANDQTAISFEKAAGFDPKPNLSPVYVLDSESPNTGAYACGGNPVIVNRDYHVRSVNGTSADVLVSRSKVLVEQWDASADRVTVENLGGHDAIVIRPVTPDGVGQRSGVIFRDGDAKLYASAFSLTEKELMSLASLLAAVVR